jgi:hypothetical protein
VELSWAKLLGVVLLLAPVPARLKEWAYAGFAIDLASALLTAHRRLFRSTPSAAKLAGSAESLQLGLCAFPLCHLGVGALIAGELFNVKSRRVAKAATLRYLLRKRVRGSCFTWNISL